MYQNFLLSTIKRKKKIVVVLLCVALILGAFYVCIKEVEKFVSNKDQIEFNDKNLENVVRNAIGKPEGPIYKYDAEKVTAIYAAKRVPSHIDSCLTYPSSNISNLEGLQYLCNLEILNLEGNSISDISQLKGLTKLKDSITDISPLKDLKQLEKLNISWNGIKSIEPLKQLTRLKELRLGDSSVFLPVGREMNKISNIDALSGMIDLEVLDIQDIGVKDISPLKNMKKLKQLFK